MKKLIFTLMLLLAGCGGGGGGGSDTAPTTTQHAPAIMNLSYSPKSVPLNSGGGMVQVNISFNFFDAGSDVNEATITVQDPVTFAVLNSVHVPVSNSAGSANGVITITLGASTATMKDVIFNVHVNDAAGNHSNPLNGSFSVY